mmetsp:Transcript_91352/g.257982  ORF Transcript_91352/g.257982 Transcript_91352/m.257982 type:complete len:325 (-) Transcript_91352:454-1428(-)
MRRGRIQSKLDSSVNRGHPSVGRVWTVTGVTTHRDHDVITVPLNVSIMGDIHGRIIPLPLLVAPRSLMVMPRPIVLMLLLLMLLLLLLTLLLLLLPHVLLAVQNIVARLFQELAPLHAELRSWTIRVAPERVRPARHALTSGTERRNNRFGIQPVQAWRHLQVKRRSGGGTRINVGRRSLLTGRRPRRDSQVPTWGGGPRCAALNRPIIAVAAIPIVRVAWCETLLHLIQWGILLLLVLLLLWQAASLLHNARRHSLRRGKRWTVPTWRQRHRMRHGSRQWRRWWRPPHLLVGLRRYHRRGPTRRRRLGARSWQRRQRAFMGSA